MIVHISLKKKDKNKKYKNNLNFTLNVLKFHYLNDLKI